MATATARANPLSYLTDQLNDLKAKGFGNLRSIETAQSDLSAAQAEVAARVCRRIRGVPLRERGKIFATIQRVENLSGFLGRIYNDDSYVKAASSVSRRRERQR